MLGVRTRSWCAHELSSSTPLISSFQIQTLQLPMRPLSSSFSPSFRAFSALAFSFCRNHHRTPPPSHPLLLSLFSSDQDSKKTDRFHPFSTSKPRPVVAAAAAAFVEHLESKDGDELGIPDPSSSLAAAATDFRSLPSPSFEVKELEDFPEQWKRSRLAWLCKELPSHKPATLIRILNGQRKWMTQEDTTYVAVHCMRIRENEAGFRAKVLFLHQQNRSSCRKFQKLEDEQKNS